ncbi:UNVERIFIED_CONTAM: hypothetical protein LK11_01775, partial [Mumia flava]
MDPPRDLLAQQHGVVARRQLLDLGYCDDDIRRWRRRRDLVELHPGVYVDHTGEPTWIQRAWGAVLCAWPAALCAASALRAYERRALYEVDRSVIQIATDRDRNVVTPAGAAVERRTGFTARVRWNYAPPRMLFEEAVLDVAIGARDEVGAVAALASACGSRRTTANRLRAAINARGRVKGRRFLQAVLRDIADGTHSVIEHGYRHRIERPHGLPSGRGQRRAVREPYRIAYRDVDLDEVVIELDGRHHGEAEQRDDDLERDLDVLVAGRPTVRLGWGQVFRRPCGTAAKVGEVLRQHG